MRVSRMTAISLFGFCSDALIMPKDPFREPAFNGEQSESFGWVKWIDLPGQPIFQYYRIRFAQVFFEKIEGGELFDKSLFHFGFSEILGGNGHEHLFLGESRRSGGNGGSTHGFGLNGGLLNSHPDQLDL